MKKGFTLVELLVVISIIGLLSSVVFSSLNSARDKADMAAAITFAEHNHSVIGAYSEIDLRFDEGSGTSAFDGKNDAVFVGSPSWSTDTYNNSGHSISLNGSSYILGDIDGSIFEGDFTIAAWFKHNSMRTWEGIFSNSTNNVADTPLLTMRNQTTQIGINRVGRADSGVFVDLGPNHYGKWIYAVVTREGNQLHVYAYVDGEMISNSGTLTWTLNNSDQYYIGRHYYGGHNFAGLIDQVNVYTEPLSIAQIDQQYNKDKNKYFAQK